VSRTGSIYVNESAPAAPSGRPRKHQRRRCTQLVAPQGEGFAVCSIPNPDSRLADVREHRLERCPECFRPGPPLGPLPQPAWLSDAERLVAARPVAAWVYDLHDPVTRATQIGMASNLVQRLRSRWRATCAGRWGVDAVPWLYDLLAEGHGDRVRLAAQPFESREVALAAERRLRDARRADRWEVSSSV
jgi:hypothetical protein